MSTKVEFFKMFKGKNWIFPDSTKLNIDWRGLFRKSRMFNPFYKNVLIINPTFEAYPGWHDMCVSVPVMKIENKDSQ